MSDEKNKNRYNDSYWLNKKYVLSTNYDTWRLKFQKKNHEKIKDFFRVSDFFIIDTTSYFF
jgi:hypothetical protein